MQQDHRTRVQAGCDRLKSLVLPDLVFRVPIGVGNRPEYGAVTHTLKQLHRIFRVHTAWETEILTAVTEIYPQIVLHRQGLQGQFLSGERCAVGWMGQAMISHIVPLMNHPGHHLRRVTYVIHGAEECGCDLFFFQYIQKLRGEILIFITAVECQIQHLFLGNIVPGQRTCPPSVKALLIADSDMVRLTIRCNAKGMVDALRCQLQQILWVIDPVFRCWQRRQTCVSDAAIGTFGQIADDCVILPRLSGSCWRSGCGCWS